MAAPMTGLQDHLKKASDDLFTEAGRAWREELAKIAGEVDRGLGTLRKVVGERPRPASRLEAFFTSLWVPPFLTEAFWQNPYWWNVVTWSLFGALVGLLWINVRTIADEVFKPKYLPTILYRLLGAPLYAIAFIFFARVIGFAAEAITTLEKTPAAAPTPLSAGLAMGTAFLAGLFIDRVHMRLRAVAERLFPSDYLGGKPKS